MGFDEAAKKLGPLESFDPGVFLDSDAGVQEVCDLVLALATAANDLHDCYFARIAAGEVAGQVTKGINKDWAWVAGLGVTTMKATVGVLREILSLVAEKKSQRAAAQPLFQKLLQQTPPETRSSWADLVAVAASGSAGSPLAAMLIRCRNKVAFHYDADRISSGYQTFFAGTGERPMISRGASMSQVRFYFADAAVESYLRSEKLDPRDPDFGKLLLDVVRSILNIVTRFVELRGGAWRAEGPR